MSRRETVWLGMAGGGRAWQDRIEWKARNLMGWAAVTSKTWWAVPMKQACINLFCILGDLNIMIPDEHAFGFD